MRRGVLKDWHKRFFRREIFTPGGAHHTAAGIKEARFVRRALGLNKGARLLDLCCGTGRHSIPLAKSGLKVIGFDTTPAYLREAKNAAKKLNVRFVKGDMRALKYEAEFDAAINLWTSFGYFTDIRDDRKVIRGIARALKPGGRFLIDIINADFLRRNAQSKRWQETADGAYLLEDLQLFEGRDPGSINTWTLLRPGKRPASAAFFVRLYDIDRLTRL
ncbi:MAG: class I SAM-dependent methyltransferase, partial [Bradyrhizobium sp.]|nr:class I SAM-dependent methyltransferase [Bradyrhizobium sp.]